MIIVYPTWPSWTLAFSAASTSNPRSSQSVKYRGSPTSSEMIKYYQQRIKIWSNMIQYDYNMVILWSNYSQNTWSRTKFPNFIWWTINHPYYLWRWQQAWRYAPLDQVKFGRFGKSGKAKEVSRPLELTIISYFCNTIQCWQSCF